MVDENNDRDISRAIGILAMIQNGSFIVHLHIINYVLGITNILSNKLQNTNGTLGEAACLINGIINTFENSRNSDSYSDVWNAIVTFSLENNIDLEMPSTIASLSKRKIQEPAALKDFHVTTATGADDEGIQYEDNAKEYWKKHVFYPVIDNIVVYMKHRFLPESLKLAI
ncbi:uncharacterized protein LOC132948975 [Metopolophium dirhodum]|uniref:uncharacterized protein LOC132948975 n=1 Tax=Metopolophium dirhodum TaxID=44670 RepID=UPI00298FBD51|nr:uncharacterized protein LOC132948975 [Metopolophium dirhodum]